MMHADFRDDYAAAREAGYALREEWRLAGLTGGRSYGSYGPTQRGGMRWIRAPTESRRLARAGADQRVHWAPLEELRRQRTPLLRE